MLEWLASNQHTGVRFPSGAFGNESGKERPPGKAVRTARRFEMILRLSWGEYEFNPQLKD